MSSTATTDPGPLIIAPRALPQPSLMQAAFALVAVLACVGAALSFGSSGATTAPAVSAQKADDIAVSVPTSFGVVAVEHLERLNGLSAQDLSGASHGIQNYVPPEQVQLQVAISITNQSNDPVRYSPAQFRIRVSSTNSLVDAQASSFGEGVLQPHSNLEARMGFVTPRDGSQLTLEFQDPERPAPVLVRLGANDIAIPSAADSGHSTTKHSEADGPQLELSDPNTQGGAASPNGGNQ